MSEDLAKQLKSACDTYQTECRDFLIAELEHVTELLPRAKALIGMANELRNRGIPFGKRLSFWFRLTHHYSVGKDPENEFDVKGKYGIGFENCYLDDMTLVSRYKDTRTEICLFEDGTIDLREDRSRIWIMPEKTIGECVDDSLPYYVLRIGSSKQVAEAIKQLLDRFDTFEHDFSEYVKTVISTLEEKDESVVNRY